MTKLTDRTLATGATLSDLIHIVITGDTSQNPAGSSYKAPLSMLSSIFGGTDAYWVSGSTGNYSIKRINDTTIDATGNYATAIGDGTIASGYASYAEGRDTIASGNSAHAEGRNTTAGGTRAHAEGQDTTSNGNFTHTEGNLTYASGDAAHAEGTGTTAIANYSHSEGSGTIASGDTSHAEGLSTIAGGDYSHSEGEQTTASNTSSHAEGRQTTASGFISHAEGFNTKSTGTTSHAEGKFTTAGGIACHAEGQSTLALNFGSHAEGVGTQALAQSCHSEGSFTTASGNFSHAEGYATTASGPSSHAEGERTLTIGNYSHAEGWFSTATGECSHAEGGSLAYTISGGVASNVASHAEGLATLASGFASHAEGYLTTASGGGSHAGGYLTVASGATSFVFGSTSIAGGTSTIVLGFGITGTTDHTTYVDNFNIKTLGTGTSVTTLGVDSNGYVVDGGAINVANTVYVMKNGDDSTGLVERFDRPFLTIGAAITAATAYFTGRTVDDRVLIDVETGAYTDCLKLYEFIDFELRDSVLTAPVGLPNMTDEYDVSPATPPANGKYTNMIYGNATFLNTNGIAFQEGQNSYFINGGRYLVHGELFHCTKGENGYIIASSVDYHVRKMVISNTLNSATINNLQLRSDSTGVYSGSCAVTINNTLMTNANVAAQQPNIVIENTGGSTALHKLTFNNSQLCNFSTTGPSIQAIEATPGKLELTLINSFIYCANAVYSLSKGNAASTFNTRIYNSYSNVVVDPTLGLTPTSLAGSLTIDTGVVFNQGNIL